MSASARKFAIPFLIVLLLFFPATVRAQEDSAPRFSRNQSIGAVRISYAEFLSALERVRSLTEVANAPRLEDTAEVLRFQDGTVSLEIEEGFAPENLGGAPDVAYDAYYLYRSPNSPISNVQIRLGDSDRHITVDGLSREQIDAVVSVFTSDMSGHRTMLGGTVARFVIYVLCFTLMPVFLWGAGKVGNIPGWLILGCAVGIIPAGFVILLSGWPPGTAIYNGDASFLVRRAPEIGFASFVVGLVALLLTLGMRGNPNGRGGGMDGDPTREG